MSRRKVQEINASSMADIAFLLLIFFLVTTTMDVNKGLSRQLPPPVERTENIEINRRNIFMVLINSQNQLMVQGELMDMRNLKDKTKEFIKNENDALHLPEKKPVEVEFFGTVYITTEHVISLQNHRGANYQAYIEVQNELVRAYNELRNEISREKFGAYYNELNEEQQTAVRKIYPQKISEAEPINYGGAR